MKEQVGNQLRRNESTPYVIRETFINDRNIEELNDDEVHAAILYLEPKPRRAGKQGNDTAATEGNDDNGVLICVGLYILLLACLAVYWMCIWCVW